ncbi:hypothetical protein IL306_011376 [Fusarium sp. DS 682]|nr:hypothetical protein IL306_011376 [Fusarium sp. DS 682]
MSFGFSVGDVLAVLSLANKIRKDFSGAPEQFKSINQDVRSLSIVIQDAYANVDQMSEEHAANFSQILTTCQTLLNKLQSLMSKWSVISDPRKGKTVQRLWKRLRWEPEEISDLRAQITSKIMLLNAFNDQATSYSVAKIVRRNDDNEKQAMLDWISSIDYIPQQNHLVSRLQANSRRWLFNSAEYQSWEKQKGQVLFCPGDPGTGKTFTTAIVLETLQEQAQDNPDVLNTFVYCTYQAPDQDVQGLICSLFRNSLQQAAKIPETILSHCVRKRTAKQALLRDETIKLLETLYSSFHKVTLLVDALDEIPTEVSRPFIAELLKLQKTCQLNLFLTSRHIPEIQNQFTNQGAATLEIRGSEEDIHQFLRDSIFQLSRFVARDPTFQTEIIEKITEASSGMFLLAELHLRSLKNKKSPKALRSSLTKLSVGSDAYDSAYQNAMARVAGLGPESEALAKQALLILIFAREPLRTEDLVYALSVEPDSETIDDENVPDIEDVAGQASTKVSKRRGRLFGAGHAKVLKELLQWSDVELDPAAGIEGISPLQKALDNENEDAALVLIPYSDANRVYPDGDRPLNLAAKARSLEAIRLLFTRGVQVNAKGRKGRTVLHSAAMAGNMEVIELILAHPDIDINIRDNDGNTPLVKLVQCLLPYPLDSALGSLNLLLSRPELDINVQNLKGDTARLIAASIRDCPVSGEENEVFNSLFHHPGVDREHRNKFGQTILVRAVVAGSRRIETIVKKTQLSHQFSEVDDDGETLLSLAAENRWFGRPSWQDIVDLSPPEFMYRKNSSGKIPGEVQGDTLYDYVP